MVYILSAEEEEDEKRSDKIFLRKMLELFKPAKEKEEKEPSISPSLFLLAFLLAQKSLLATFCVDISPRRMMMKKERPHVSSNNNNIEYTRMI